MNGYFQLTKHKFFEWDLNRKFATQWFELSFIWTRKQDHPGFFFVFSIFKLFFLELCVYDHRHWNCMTQSYEERKELPTPSI